AWEGRSPEGRRARACDHSCTVSRSCFFCRAGATASHLHILSASLISSCTHKPDCANITQAVSSRTQPRPEQQLSPAAAKLRLLKSLRCTLKYEKLAWGAGAKLVAGVDE